MAGTNPTPTPPATPPAAASSAPVPSVATGADVASGATVTTVAPDAPPVPEAPKPRVGLVNGERNQRITIGSQPYYDGDRLIEGEHVDSAEFDRLLEDKGIYVEGTSRPKMKRARTTKAGKPDDYDPDDDDDDFDDEDDDDDDDEDPDGKEVRGNHQGRDVIASGALAKSARKHS